MAWPERLAQLVREFSNVAARDERFKEDWARSEYIEPFFEALGWKRLNPATLTNHSVGFVREQSQHHGAATKTPDYSFLIDGHVAFVGEAKRPASAIKSRSQERVSIATLWIQRR
jgi:hypothetical protein